MVSKKKWYTISDMAEELNYDPRTMKTLAITNLILKWGTVQTKEGSPIKVSAIAWNYYLYSIRRFLVTGEIFSTVEKTAKNYNLTKAKIESLIKGGKIYAKNEGTSGAPVWKIPNYFMQLFIQGKEKASLKINTKEDVK